MKNKVFLGSLFLVFILILTSCGVVPIGNNEGQLTFTLGEDVVNVISSRQARIDEEMGDDTEELEYSVKVSLSGEYSTTLEKTASASTLATIPFEFKGIPMGATVRASCIVSTSSGVQLWSGSSNSVKIAGATNRASITLGVHTGIVVWDGIGGPDTTTFNLSIASSPADVERATPLKNDISTYELPVFTFGNNGELYYFDENQDNSIMVSRRDAQGVYREASKYCDGNITGSLSRDRVTGKLYGLSDTIVVRLEDGAQAEDLRLDGGNGAAGFVVEDDVFYLYSEVENGENADSGETTSSNTYQITVGKYTIDFVSSNDEGSTASQLDEKTITLPIDGLSPDSFDNISDAIIQDGALYLLLRDVDVLTSSPGSTTCNLYSRGGLIKIKLPSMELDTSFGNGGILGWTTESTSFFSNDIRVSFYGPLNENSTNFIGPVKFVGIMPKKLVIAEHGVHITSQDPSGLKSKIKSRVLVVDLETASANVEWDEDYTSSSSSYYYTTKDVTFPTVETSVY